MDQQLQKSATPKVPPTDDNAPRQPKTLPREPRLARLDLIQHIRQVWACKAPPGIKAEDLTRADFWRLVSKKMNRHDHVYVLGDLEDWEAECRVEASHPDGADVSVVKIIKRKAIVQNQTVLGDGEYVTRYQNGSWCVLRVKDQHTVLQGHATEGAAITTWLREQPRRVS